MAKQTIGASISKDDIDKLLGNLKNISSEITEKVKDEIELTAIEIETDAKQLCPVDTGRLRSSIKALTDRDKMAALVGSNVEYAAFVELGTNKQEAHPYLYPAFFKNMHKLFDRLTKILDGVKES